ncbi:hypothetical protein LEP1GSC034_2388 [Leptospira interrogans str. 2003000735]|uniref:PIN domain-containing protein n=8 Tax=Leptospira interrogans TaxID=173 RepID=A0AAP9W981_LEPIR|nr:MULTISPECIES: hypothetical protein [Leptospira]EMF40536.1 hypothetical protein LEP1GSC067_0096 [Leptospira interrogans serovar Lora str. TE 1992]EMF72066.1 hypothetical protein LEP1GSC148_3377 [Leptospira interrogans serovar Canicola str. LT1962]EMM94028.1 hypothetical protein LEP1GSC158_4229 [Leptospira interrogans serovar Zanoni str. LT2156]EMN31857.1 hypothetical protein LEP1GSC083_3547 [Leptospira interrogans serovar Pyrogenes str. L0374]EMN48244.1 hypothetical protein LEP1GSC088_3758 [
MKYYLSKSLLEIVIQDPSDLKTIVVESIERLIKEQHLFYTGTISILPLLEKEKDPIQKEIIWSQIKRLCLEILDFKAENLSLAQKLSLEFGNIEWVWNEISIAIQKDLDGFITVDKNLPDQKMIKILLAQKINFNGIT